MNKKTLYSVVVTTGYTLMILGTLSGFFIVGAAGAIAYLVPRLACRPENPEKDFAATSGLLLMPLGLLLFFIGAVNIELRTVLTGIVAFFTPAAAGLIGLRSKRIGRIVRLTAVPALVTLWGGMSLHNEYTDAYVIPTPEYEEWFPRVYDDSGPELTLREAPDFRIEGEPPRVDGATSFVGMYACFCKSVGIWKYDYSKTPGAYRKLADGKADLIFAFRPSEKQAAEAREKGRELSLTPIGYDAFVFFVNQDNPVDSLSVRQAKDIYAGKIRNWKEVGGRNESIAAYQRYEGSGSQSRMERFMAGEPLMAPEREWRIETMMGIVDRVARYHNYESAIGYSFYLYVDAMLAGGGVKLLKIDGVAPSPETIRDGSYPLVDEICAVTAGGENPNVQPMVEWILSPQGQAIVKEAGYLPVGPVKAGAAVTRSRF